MKMKKALGTLFAVAFLCGLLAGCGGAATEDG